MSKSKKPLKLYLWDGPLIQWENGVVFALAESVGKAIELVKARGLDYPKRWNGTKLDGVEVQEFEEPEGWVYTGSKTNGKK